jgi:hypothetical protein
MAKGKNYWAVQAGTGEMTPDSAAFAAQLKGEDTFQWPAEPTERAWIWGVTEDPYVVEVELVRDSAGSLVPVGVAVRRTFSTSRRKKGRRYPFAEGTAPEPIVAVDLRRIPMGRAIRAALNAVGQPFPTDERHDELDRILVPRGRPRRGRSAKFYREILEAVSYCEQRGLSPAKEIARRKSESENLVHQWIHVARRRYSGSSGGDDGE